jgi:hypothetical protein
VEHNGTVRSNLVGQISMNFIVLKNLMNFDSKGIKLPNPLTRFLSMH